MVCFSQIQVCPFHILDTYETPKSEKQRGSEVVPKTRKTNDPEGPLCCLPFLCLFSPLLLFSIKSSVSFCILVMNWECWEGDRQKGGSMNRETSDCPFLGARGYSERPWACSCVRRSVLCYHRTLPISLTGSSAFCHGFLGYRAQVMKLSTCHY